MSYDGNGVYNPPTPEYPAIPNTVILSAYFNTIIEDLATALSIAWPRDGQADATGDMPLGDHKLTGLRNGSAPQDATTVLQVFTDPTFITTTVLGMQITGTALTVTTTVVNLPANTNIGSVTAAEIAFLSGLTENVQVGLNNKANLVGGNTFSGIQILQAALDSASTAVTQPSLDNTTAVATTAFVQQAALNSAVPLQTGNAGRFLYTDGTDASWRFNSPDLPLMTLGVY